VTRKILTATTLLAEEKIVNETQKENTGRDTRKLNGG